MKTMTYKAEDFVPVMACPSQVDKIRNVSELEGTEIDQVFIGSCTNGRLEDLRSCGRSTQREESCRLCEADRYTGKPQDLQTGTGRRNAGYFGRSRCDHYTSGVRIVLRKNGGILSDGERVVATNNRNFLGRMGTSKVEIYLASPRTAAACAVAGKIVNPE